jgi:selenocysteine-specific translation elongation factor
MGKAATVNDIAMYNHASSEGVFTYVSVNSEKIQTLLQVINMIDVPVIVINELTAALGEQMIAIAEYGFDRGFIILENMASEQISPLVKGTCIENFQIVKDHIELVQEIKKLEIRRPGSELSVPVDNYFNVKSVGTVILGIVKSGVVKKYDKVVIEPLGKEVMIKGIQSQDNDLDQAFAGMRVGLNLKGIEANEIRRGYVIGKSEKSAGIRLDFAGSKYWKEPLKPGEQVFVSSGLMVSTATVKSLNPLELQTDGFFLYGRDSKFMIASTAQKMPRVIGKGVLA